MLKWMCNRRECKDRPIIKIDGKIRCSCCGRNAVQVAREYKRLADMTNEEAQEECKSVGESVDVVLGPCKMFILMYMDKDGEGGTVGNYVSSCERANIPKALREFADVLERGLDGPVKSARE